MAPARAVDPRKEIEQLRKVIGLAPTFARAHLALGKALLQDGKVPDAIGELQEAARLEPTSGEAHYQLGLALARAGRKEEAAAELQKGRELVAADDRHQNADLDIAEGRAALEKGDLELAAAKLRHAIQLRPASSEAQRYLARARQQGDSRRASGPKPKSGGLSDTPTACEAVFQPLAWEPATNPLPPWTMPAGRGARGLYSRGQVQGSRAAARRRTSKQRPTSSWGWYALGYSLFAQQKIGESIKALAKSLELDIRNAEAHKILGRNLMIIGRFDAAQVEFEQGLRYKPDSAEMHYNLGKLFSIQDNWEPARKAFEAALRDRSLVHRGDRRPRLRAGSAGRRCRRGREL